MLYALRERMKLGFSFSILSMAVIIVSMNHSQPTSIQLFNESGVPPRCVCPKLGTIPCYTAPPQVMNEKNPGCLGHIGDCTAQLYGDYYKPLYYNPY